MELSVIIVNYNVCEFLEQALNSILRAAKDIKSEIIVVDNNSHDKSVQMLREKFPSVIIIANKKNTGFATANNQALNIARGEFILLINPDTIVQENTLSVMLDFFHQNPKTGMAGCKILNPDGSLQLACRRSIPTPFIAFTRLFGLASLFPKSRIFGKYNLTYLDPDKMYEVEAISGSFMMVRKAALEQVGFLDEQFFMYGEDLDWMYRFAQAGWKVFYVPDTSIIHFKGESAKISKLDPLLAFYKSMDIFANKHFRNKYRFGSLFFIRSAIFFQAVISFIRHFSKMVLYPAADLLLLVFALLTAVYIRFGGLVAMPQYYDWRSYCIVVGVPVTLIMVFLIRNRIYSKYPLSIGKAVSAIFWGTVIVSALTFFFKSYAFSRLVVIYFSLFSVVLLSGWRLIKRLLSGYSKSGDFNVNLLESFSRKTLIAGNREKCIDVYRKLRSNGYANICGFVFEGEQAGTSDAEGLPVYTSLESLDEIISAQHIEEVVFAAPLNSYDKVIEVSALNYQRKIQFRLVPDSLEVLIGTSSIDRIDRLPMIDIEIRLNDPVNKLTKRLFDLFVASFYLFIYFIKFNALKLRHGPIISKSRYATVYGDIFTQKSAGNSDERIVRFLNFYYRLRNVIRGNASMIGGEWITEEEFAASGTPLLIKSGIIDVSAELDQSYLKGGGEGSAVLFYMQNYSLELDIRLLRRFIKEKKKF